MPVFLLLAVLALIQSFAVGALLTPLARRWGPRLGMVDLPNEARKVHTAPIPRSGGLAVFAAFWGCLAVDLALAMWVVPGLSWLPEPIRLYAANVGSAPAMKPLAGIAVGALMIFVLGAVDDARGLSPKLRLAVQILSVAPLILGGVVARLFLPSAMEPLAWVLTGLWVVLLTNSLNFLDNMNGLTSGVSIIVALILAVTSFLSGEWFMLLTFALLAGAALGFWIYNFPKASVFLGDSGSTHLGFLLAALTVVATYYDRGAPTKLPVLLPLIVLGVPLFDTLTVLWIRWRTGKPFMQGDRNHFSHRLVDLGMSKMEAVLFIYGVTLCVGLAALVLRPLGWQYGLVQLGVIVLLFAALYWMERVSKRRG